MSREGKPVRGTGKVRGAGALGRAAGAGTAMLRAAAALAWFTGLCFGLPCAYAIWYFADRGEVWTFLGFPTYGGGRLRTSGSRPQCPCWWRTAARTAAASTTTGKPGPATA